MKRSPLLVAGIAATAAVGLAIIPSAATAHTDHLFTWAFNPEVEPEVAGFATTSKTDASLAFLGTDTIDDIFAPTGMEVCAEVGYAVTSPEGDGLPSLYTWNHDTGAILTGPIELSVLEGEVEFVVELDTLADCTVLTIADLSGDNPEYAVVSVDPVTGVVEPIVELTDEGLEVTGIATDPSGVTYLFGEDDGSPLVTTVDLAAGTIGEWVEQSGITGYFQSSGFTLGVDFDAAGGLWIITGVNSQEEYHLVSVAAGADVATGAVTDIGILPYYETPQQLEVESPIPLTAEGAAVVQPQLAATGAEPPVGLLAGALLLLTGGIAAIILTRRRAA